MRKNAKGERIWADLTGPWGEAQKILQVEAGAILELLKKEVASQAASQRVIDSRLIALSHAHESVRYLVLGEVPTAATHLVAADAWHAVSTMPDEEHDATAELVNRGVVAAPLVAELRKSSDQILGEHCADFHCDLEGHELEPVHADALPGRRRRCLGPRNGFHPILATVARAACARSRGPTPKGPAVTWHPLLAWSK